MFESVKMMAGSRCYGVSPEGFVVSFKGKTPKKMKGFYSRGYHRVNLSLGTRGHSRHISTHREIARVFLPEFREDLVVNHINGNKADNRLVNLECITQSENILHAIELGLLKIKTDISKRSLTLKEIEFIIYSDGTARPVAEKLGVHISTVHKIRNKFKNKD